MAKTAVAMATKHQISLGMDSDGYYVIHNPQTREVVAMSNRPTGKSAIIMMQRFIQRPEHLRYWR